MLARRRHCATRERSVPGGGVTHRHGSMALKARRCDEAGVQVTQGLLLVFAILLEIPIAMILVSRILKRGANRWANTVAAVITTVFVVGGGSLDLHSVFFATVEVD